MDLGATDGQLVREVIAGRRQAFDELIRRHQRQAFAVSYRLLGRSEDALDVMQNAFTKAFTSIGTVQDPEAFAGWLMRIVSNLSLNYRRGRKNNQQLPLDDLLEAGPGELAAASDDPSRRLAGLELGDKMQKALDQLPPKQRLALVMFTIEQMPQKAVAEALQCSVEAVKWHVFQGRKKLRELLGDYLKD
jgi:RNA polymerase sigma-70 factor (ECF subfamily)